MRNQDWASHSSDSALNSDLVSKAVRGDAAALAALIASPYTLSDEISLAASMLQQSDHPNLLALCAIAVTTGWFEKFERAMTDPRAIAAVLTAIDDNPNLRHHLQQIIWELPKLIEIMSVPETLNDERLRRMLIHLAAPSPSASAVLMDRIGPDGWESLNDEDADVLLRSVLPGIVEPFDIIGKIWHRFSPQQRNVVFEACMESSAHFPFAPAWLASSIGAQGWRLLDAVQQDRLHEALLQFQSTKTDEALRLIWFELSPQQREKTITAFSVDQRHAIKLLRIIAMLKDDDAMNGVVGDRLFQVAARTPQDAYRTAVTLWDELPPYRIKQLVDIVSADPHTAHQLADFQAHREEEQPQKRILPRTR